MDTTLIYKKEKIYFVLLLISSLLLYFFFIISIIGIFILFLLILVPLIVFLINLGHIRTNGVKVTKNQFPSIYQMVEKISGDMEIAKLPDVYIVQSEGMLNAFASKFFRKNMIVIYSEFADLLIAKKEKELSFVIAHELAHLKRNHIIKQFFLLPGNWIPFLGSAYSRACEYTCDSMAAHYISDLNSSKNALTILAAGKQLYQHVDLNDYILEASKEDNLFSWFSEKISTHPTLPKRIAYIQNKFGEPYQFDFKTSFTVKMIVSGLAAGLLIFFIGGFLGFQAFQKTFFYSNFMLDSENTTPLMLAASNGDIDKLKELLNEDIDLNSKDVDGWTALHYAISWQDFAMEEYEELIENDTNVEMVRLLLENGADPNAIDQYGDTIVGYAITQGFFESAKLLINKGADVNIKDEFGETPLFDAVYIDDEEMVQFLLDNGALVTIENTDGKTVIDIADENNNKELLAILKNFQ